MNHDARRTLCVSFRGVRSRAVGGSKAAVSAAASAANGQAAEGAAGAEAGACTAAPPPGLAGGLQATPQPARQRTQREEQTKQAEHMDAALLERAQQLQQRQRAILQARGACLVAQC